MSSPLEGVNGRERAAQDPVARALANAARSPRLAPPTDTPAPAAVQADGGHDAAVLLVRSLLPVRDMLNWTQQEDAWVCRETRERRPL